MIHPSVGKRIIAIETPVKTPMYVFRHNDPLGHYLDNQRNDGRRIGFVPTMGALHEGHMTLVRRAQSACDVTVVSIFVNPTQFNDTSDLDKYPRPLDSDLDMLFGLDCDVAFVPLPDQVYPPGLDTELEIDFRGLDRFMEGEHRPGHFAGVAQVVKRLLDLVGPDALYMGQKDFQQTAIVRRMIEVLNLPVELVVCPTQRDADGLALSSRNALLSADMRSKAPAIYRVLTETARRIEERPLGELKREAMIGLSNAGLEPEYFEIVDGYTLQPLQDLGETDFAVACTAVRAGDVRLIDNVIVKDE